MLKTTHMFIKKRMNKLVVIMQKNTNQQKKTEQLLIHTTIGTNFTNIIPQ